MKTYNLKLLSIIFIFIFLIALVSAADWDNKKGDLTIDETTSKYGKIDIRNSFLGIPFLQLDKVATLELKKNTDYCNEDCSANIEIIMYEKGVLIQSVRFMNEDKTLESRIDEYQFYIKDNNQWKKYNLGDKVSKGTYEIKLEGKKGAFQSVDWQITSQGFLIDEWATWTSSLNTGLIAYWAFDEGTGTNVQDAQSGINNATISDTTEIVWDADDCMIGNCLNFSIPYAGGMNSSANDSLVSPETGELTISFWIKPRIYADMTVFQTKSTAAEWNIYIGSGVDTNLRFAISGASVGGTTINNTWQHIVLTYREGINMTSWINGVVTEGSALTDAFTEATDILTFGGARPASNYDGLMDEVAVWDRNLTSDEISDLYNGGAGIAYSTATIYVTLDAPTDATSTTNTTLTFNSSATSENAFVNATTTIWNSSYDIFYNITSAVTGLSDTTNIDANSLAIDSYNWNVEYCDVIHTCTSATSNYTFDITAVTENSQTYNSTAVETSSNAFIANISYESSIYTVITGRLFYNNTWYAGTKTGSGDEAIFTKSITAPDVSTATNISFTWELSATSGSGTFIQNLTGYNQTVSPIIMHICDATYTTPYINFTIKDEDDLTTMNATFEAVFDYRAVGADVSNTYNFSDTVGLNSTYDFCFSPTDENYEIDATIELGASNYVIKFYTLDGLALTNVTTEQTLYMLESGNSTSFIILVRDAQYDAIENAIVHVQRYDVGTDQWLTTEIVETNYEGKANSHLLSEDANYRFLVYTGGTLQYTSSSTKIVCEVTPCTVTLTLPGTTTDNYEPFEQPSDFTSTLTWNADDFIFTYTYSDTSTTFTSARLNVVRLDYGNSSIISPACNETKTTASGVITCDISSVTIPNGTYVATGYLTRTTFSDRVVRRIIRYKIASIVDTIGLDGVLWAFFLFMAIVMIGVARPSLGIIAGIVGVIFLSVIQLIQISIGAVVAIIAIAVILLVEVNRQ